MEENYVKNNPFWNKIRFWSEIRLRITLFGVKLGENYSFWTKNNFLKVTVTKAARQTELGPSWVLPQYLFCIGYSSAIWKKHVQVSSKISFHECGFFQNCTRNHAIILTQKLISNS